MKTPILFSVAAVLGLASAAFGTTTLSLEPASGRISGEAGSTIGWGFSLSNSADYAVVSSSNFCLASSGVTSLCIAPTIGTYADYIATNFVIAGQSPESPIVTEAFNASTRTGLGTFTISAGVKDGASDVGQIVVTYDLYSVDPNSQSFNPNSDLISTGNFLTDPATVDVGASTSVAPEPSYWVVLAVGIVVSLLRQRRIQTSGSQA